MQLDTWTRNSVVRASCRNKGVMLLRSPQLLTFIWPPASAGKWRPLDSAVHFQCCPSILWPKMLYALPIGTCDSRREPGTLEFPCVGASI